jgi:hypothetical protein
VEALDIERSQLCINDPLKLTGHLGLLILVVTQNEIEWIKLPGCDLSVNGGGCNHRET